MGALHNVIVSKPNRLIFEFESRWVPNTSRLVPQLNLIILMGGARGVMVIVIGNGHDDTSSNPGRDWLHFT